MFLVFLRRGDRVIQDFRGTWKADFSEIAPRVNNHVCPQQTRVPTSPSRHHNTPRCRTDMAGRTTLVLAREKVESESMNWGTGSKVRAANLLTYHSWTHNISWTDQTAIACHGRSKLSKLSIVRGMIWSRYRSRDKWVAVTEGRPLKPSNRTDDKSRLSNKMLTVLNKFVNKMKTIK